MAITTSPSTTSAAIGQSGAVSRTQRAGVDSSQKSSEIVRDNEAADYHRIENSDGVFLAGPAYVRGDEEIRDIATFSPESLAALDASQQGRGAGITLGEPLA